VSVGLDGKQVELERLRPAYLRAQRTLQDPVVFSEAMDRVMELLGMYHGDPLERAAWILGQIKEALRPIELARKAIRDFESRRQSIGRLEDVTR